MKIIFILPLLINIRCLTFIEMFGMGELLQNLGKIKPVTNLQGEQSVAYMLDPNIYTFLKQFRNRTQFCDYKCQHIFNLPCFLLFGCNIQIRNFILIIVFPLIFLTLLGLCCGRGIWTFRCWLKYLVVFTGITFMIWLFRKCASSEKIRDRKILKKQNIENGKKGGQENELEVDIVGNQVLQRDQKNLTSEIETL